MKVVTVAEMREVEQRAEREYGLTSPILMEHAGRSVAERLRAHVGGDVSRRNVLVLVGPGNNGGDGRVMGRYLAQWGARVSYYVWKERRLEFDRHQMTVGRDQAELRVALAGADIVADALLGTGASRPLDPTMRSLMALVTAEKQRRPDLLVLAVDLPTGLNSDTGAVDPGTIRADLTITLAFPKVGLLLFPGADYVGELQVGGIGLPDDMPITTGLELLDAALVRSMLPKRPLDSNKGTFGKVMVVAGSSLYIGAAYLAAAACGRIGAGLVTLATTADRAPTYAMKLAEATYHLLPPESAPPQARAQSILDALTDYKALVVGPGLGQDEATGAFLDHLF
ncbi:MAG: NAD(P)H-hydrate epimerase, partial [Ktedonobacterales bacterium]